MGCLHITGIERDSDQWWHVLSDPAAVPEGQVKVRIDAEHRNRVAQLHTDSHVLNALVFDAFDGALVTGAQINADGTGRMDFDLPEITGDELLAARAAVNDVIRQGVSVRSTYVDVAEAKTTPGLVRSLSVAPPPTRTGGCESSRSPASTGRRAAGPHLDNTGRSCTLSHRQGGEQGRRNRRVRFVLDPPA